MLNEMLQQKKTSTIKPIFSVFPEQFEGSGPNSAESLLLTTAQLKSEILKFEGDSTTIKSLESQLKVLREKVDFLEKTNKELQSTAAGSDDSLDLGSENIKETIEIQELRAALHSMSEKYEQEKETLIRDMIESRQDMETQLFRVQNEKNFLEVKLKDSEKLIEELKIEKERQSQIVMVLKKDIEKMRDSLTSYECTPRSTASQKRSGFNPSQDYELTESIEKFDSRSSNFYELLQEEISEIINKIKEFQLIPGENDFGLILLRKLIESFKAIKEIVDKEYEGSPLKETDLKLVLILTTLKTKAQKEADLNEELRKRLRELENLRRVSTEPSARRFSPGTEMIKTQIQLEKNKVLNKKHEIHLHREQITALKKTIRELQHELDRRGKDHTKLVKELWVSIFKDIPSLNANIEDLIESFMKNLGFTNSEAKALQNERKARRSRHKFGFFG
jgi:predicted nucleic acid-binding protein